MSSCMRVYATTAVAIVRGLVVTVVLRRFARVLSTVKQVAVATMLYCHLISTGRQGVIGADTGRIPDLFPEVSETAGDRGEPSRGRENENCWGRCALLTLIGTKREKSALGCPSRGKRGPEILDKPPA